MMKEMQYALAMRLLDKAVSLLDEAYAAHCAGAQQQAA